MNKTILMGRITADPELRHSQSGTEWTAFNIAVDRRGAKEGQQRTDFIPCKAFNKTAEFIAKYFTKGAMIAVDGELQSSTYEDNGKKRTSYSVLVWNAYFTGEKRDSSGYQTMPNYSEPQDSGYPYQGSGNYVQPPAQQSINFNNPGDGFVDLPDDEVTEDDLPF